MPTAEQVMKRLESLGKDTHRRTFARHGVQGEYFGVPYADLYKVQKDLGVDQQLAEQLWATGNHDARVLAAFIADRDRIKAKTLDTWANTVDNQLSLDAIAGIAAKSPLGRTRAEKWIAAKREWLAACGWHLIAALAPQPDGPFDDAEVEALLDRIEAEIHDERNRVKHSMNGALIAISARSPAFTKRCAAVAKRIGKVDVDHGGTACKTPDAVPYIQKMAARAKAKRRPAKKPARRSATS